MNTTEGRLYLTALSSLDKIDIQFYPEGVNPTRAANWAGIQVVGRNNPIHHYTGGDNRLSLELDFYANVEDRSDVVSKCRMLESWAMNDGFENPPERIKLTFGKLFKPNEVWIISGIAPNYSLFDPANGMLPRQARVKLDLVLDTNSNRKTSDVLWS